MKGYYYFFFWHLRLKGLCTWKDRPNGGMSHEALHPKAWSESEELTSEPGDFLETLLNCSLLAMKPSHF